MKQSLPTKNPTVPLMIHFRDRADAVRGLSAWGGRSLSMDRIREVDLATRLGSPRPWIESLVQEVLASDSQRVVLIDPDYSLFMGDPEQNRERVFSGLASEGITVSELRTHSARPPHSSRLYSRTA